ncbi:MAG: adenylate/guanylate cyclase domain-containing protein [Panacagrimonas sp.]
MIFQLPADWLPSLLVALVGLGIGVAFLVADFRAPTSRALGVAFIAFGAAVGLSQPLIGDTGPVPAAGRWLALADAVALIASLEWVRRVRRTIAVEHLHVGVSDVLLRCGQVSGLCFGLFGVYAPEVRRDEFLGAVNNVYALTRPGFWLFATPVVISIFTGAVATLLLLLARPDRSERIRIIAAVVGFPLIVAGIVLQTNIGALMMVAGQVIFLIGAMQYLVVQGQRGQFLARFLSPQVEKLVRERGLRHAVQHRSLEITVVCSDLRGFTAFAQAHPSSSVIKTLREYYNAVGKVVAEYGGTVKDYAGDGILILVGAPLAVPNHAHSGLEMAQLIREAASEVTRRWSTEAFPLGVGMGVASGLVTVGIIGSSSRWEYTAVGPAVNLASRLCEQAEHRQILVDARTVELAGHAGLQARPPMQVKGFAEPVASWLLPALESGSADKNPTSRSG